MGAKNTTINTWTILFCLSNKDGIRSAVTGSVFTLESNKILLYHLYVGVISSAY
jgi:hypothetical protein